MATPASRIMIRLSADQRAALRRLVRTGTHPAHARRRAAILPRADAGGPDRRTDDRIADAVGASRNTAWRVRAQFAAEGLDATLHEKAATGRQYRELDGAQEARLIALACSPAPGGRARWAMKLLADELVELAVVESIDPAAVWRTLQKTTPSRGRSRRG